jgi:hypothetical protein
MEQRRTKKYPDALVAFGRRVSADDAFSELVAARGWRVEDWKPTFVAASELESPPPLPCDQRSPIDAWNCKQVLRPPELQPPTCHPPPGNPESRLMVASPDALPTLYFVEWHYIDFVLSCVGNVSEAARVLAVRRSTLQRKRKKNPPAR